MGSDNHFLSPLLFGVPRLDELLGYLADDEIESKLFGSLETRTSLTILGEDGTGKSVFALHLAAAYAALHFRRSKAPGAAKSKLPLIVYASSDHRASAAESIWKNFYLDYPWLRYVPSISGEERMFRATQLDNNDPMEVRFVAKEPREVVKHILVGRDRATEHYELVFIDLASESTGDDWRFVSSLVAACRKDDDQPPNLLIVDSVAGFETLVGDTNSFGEKSSRRSRISQLLRAAGESWHVVFVVEEPDGIRHHPEEYVTDTVIHLKRTGTNEKVRRFLEIEKSRARNFAQGEHPFEVRDGRGTSTRSWENPDDPETLLHPKAKHLLNEKGLNKDRKPYSAYLQVFPSLHSLSKQFGGHHQLVSTATATGREPAGDSSERLRFGIEYLDNMLREEWHPSGPASPQAPEGLKGGSITALIGDEGTRKVALAEAFLMHAYEDLANVVDLFLELSVRYRKKLAGLSAVERDRDKGFLNYIHLSGGELLNNSHANAETKRRLTDAFAGFNDHFIREREELRDLASEHYKLKDPDPKKAPPLKTRWEIGKHVEPNTDLTDPIREVRALLALAFSVLRLSGGALPPTVFVATHDSSGEQIAKRVLDLHWEEVRARIKDHTDASYEVIDGHRGFLQRVLESWIRVRRVELIDATAPQLWHVIEDAVIQGISQLGYPLATVSTKVEPLANANQVRVVISDLRILRDTYPAVADDPLFLPTMVFRLKRYGVTTIIVESDDGRLNQTPGDAMSGALRSLVDHQINTWKVSFFGEQRVAIAVLPSLGTSSACLIRELRFHDGKLIVDPLFENFENIDEGKPKAIPLQVHLYNETEAFAEYGKAEEGVFNLVLAPEGQESGVLRLGEPAEYMAFRDYIHFPTDRKLPFSLVMMVDGYWALGNNEKNALANQYQYLFRRLPNSEPRFEDPLKLFMNTGGDSQNALRERRIDFFDQDRHEKPKFYRHRINDTFEGIDRVPFMWDFGFLLFNKEQWNRAKESKLTGRYQGINVGAISGKLTIPSHIRRLCADDLHGSAVAGGVVSWREFLEACKLVSETEQKRVQGPSCPFDLAMTSPDSLSCFLLEIWFSEIRKDLLDFETFHGDQKWRRRYSEDSLKPIDKWIGETKNALVGVSSREYDPTPKAPRGLWHFVNERILTPEEWEVVQRGYKNRKPPGASTDAAKAQDAVLSRFLLMQNCPGYSLQLYESWLLLLEVLDFKAFLSDTSSFELARDREPHPSSAAVRHWYKTACAFSVGQKKQADQLMIPARLPGHFSVRGDWFLGIARGSRSVRLAEQAIDILTSRRANRARLHAGLGLPVRDLLPPHEIGHIRTGLTVPTAAEMHPLTYRDVVEMGGDFLSDETTRPAHGFYWLFRTGMAGYDRQAIVARRWLQRMISQTVLYRFNNASHWLVLLGHKSTFWCRIVLWEHASPCQAHKRDALRHIWGAWRSPQGMKTGKRR